jgi:hypothetical protein
LKKIRIGSGAGYGGDRIEPAMDLIENGNIQYIIFECLAERTIALAQLQKLKDPNKGYNELLEYRMRKILPLCRNNQVKVITNMGAANPTAAAEKIKEIANGLNLDQPLRIAVVLGDDIYSQIGRYLDFPIIETGDPLRFIQSSIISANAYIGAAGIAEALTKGADIVVTGRAADPALVLGALMYEFGWKPNDYHLLGKGILAGHLLECGAQVTGGYYADPGVKDVPELWNVGYPIAEVGEDGNITITKLEGTGGLVSEGTVKEQVLYEIHDPASYFTPDVIADFSGVSVDLLSKDTVTVTGASGEAPSGLYKASIGYCDGYITECEISYGGSSAFERAQLSADVVMKRLKQIGVTPQEVRTDYIGINSLYREPMSRKLNGEKNEFQDVRLRFAARTLHHEDAVMIGYEFESLMTNGPAGGGGVRVHTREVIAIGSILVPSDDIQIEVKIDEVLTL